MNSKIHEINGYIQTIYLVEENGKFLLLDGCCRPDVELVQSYIENELGKKLSDLKLVVSTHAHPDHSGGLKFFKDKGVSVAGPERLFLWYGGMSGILTYWIDILLTHLVAINKKKGVKNIFFPRKVPLDLVLREGDKVPGFEEWKVLECPGHTDMDLTLYKASERIAYVADNFVGSKRNVFRPYPISFPEKYKKSLQRYIDLGVEEFLIAHHGRVKIPTERIQNLILTTPVRPRKHINTLPAIFLKLFKSLLRK